MTLLHAYALIAFDEAIDVIRRRFEVEPSLLRRTLEPLLDRALVVVLAVAKAERIQAVALAV